MIENILIEIDKQTLILEQAQAASQVDHEAAWLVAQEALFPLFDEVFSRDSAGLARMGVLLYLLKDYATDDARWGIVRDIDMLATWAERSNNPRGGLKAGLFILQKSLLVVDGQLVPLEEDGSTQAPFNAFLSEVVDLYAKVHEVDQEEAQYQVILSSAAGALGL